MKKKSLSEYTQGLQSRTEKQEQEQELYELRAQHALDQFEKRKLQERLDHFFTLIEDGKLVELT